MKIANILALRKLCDYDSIPLRYTFLIPLFYLPSREVYRYHLGPYNETVEEIFGDE